MFSRHKLVDAIKEIKNTAPGHDEVVNNFIKNVPKEYIDYMLSMFDKSWIEETVPSDWKLGLIVPMCKPNKPAED